MNRYDTQSGTLVEPNGRDLFGKPLYGPDDEPAEALDKAPYASVVHHAARRAENAVAALRGVLRTIPQGGASEAVPFSTVRGSSVAEMLSLLRAIRKDAEPHVAEWS